MKEFFIMLMFFLMFQESTAHPLLNQNKSKSDLRSHASQTRRG
jgi:hypothetical protein